MRDGVVKECSSKEVTPELPFNGKHFLPAELEMVSICSVTFIQISSYSPSPSPSTKQTLNPFGPTLDFLKDGSAGRFKCSDDVCVLFCS